MAEAPRSSSKPYFRPRRLAHVNYWVRDVENVGRFYREVVGCQEAYRRPMIQAIFMTNGNTYHDFAFMDVDGPAAKGGGKEHRNKRAPGLHHIAFELNSELEMVEGYDRALADGRSFAFTMSADVAHSVYDDDPDGNVYEVYADVDCDWTRRKGIVGFKPAWKPHDTEVVKDELYPVNPKITIVPDSVFRMRRVAHAVFVAADYEAMLDHYTGVVGLDVLYGGKESPFTLLTGSLGEWSMAIFRPAAGLTAGLHHAGLEVGSEEDLDRAEREARSRGIEIERRVDHPIRRALYARDPCGQLLQFFVDRQRDVKLLSQLDAATALYVL